MTSMTGIRQPAPLLIGTGYLHNKPRSWCTQQHRTCDGDQPIVVFDYDVVSQRRGCVLGLGVDRKRPDAAPCRSHVCTPHLTGRIRGSSALHAESQLQQKLIKMTPAWLRLLKQGKQPSISSVGQ